MRSGFKVYDVEVFVPNGDKQVQLRVRVAEVNDKAIKELGFDWYGEGTSNTPWIDGFVKGGLLTSKISPVASDPNTKTWYRSASRHVSTDSRIARRSELPASAGRNTRSSGGIARIIGHVRRVPVPRASSPRSGARVAPRRVRRSVARRLDRIECVISSQVFLGQDVYARVRAGKANTVGSEAEPRRLTFSRRFEAELHCRSMVGRQLSSTSSEGWASVA